MNNQRWDKSSREQAEVGWPVWILSAVVMFAFIALVLAGLAAVGHPFWGLMSAVVGVLGGLTLLRLFARRRRQGKVRC